MAETIEAEALPIEREITPTSGLDQLVADITAEAQRLSAEYLPREIADEEDYKQSKRERAGARKDIAELKGRYDTQMRAIKDAVKEADARIKAALDPLNQIDSGYKAEVDAYEARWKSRRVASLAEAYADFAPDLVPLVPFERLMARYGNERGRQWDARSLSDKQAEEAMRKAVEAVAHDERFITDSPYDAEDKAALKADFFRTLDLSGALRRTQEAKEQRERVARLEQERREREAAAAAEAERLRAEREAAQARIEDQRPEERPRKPIDTHTQMTREEYEEALAATGTPLTPRQRLVQSAAVRAGSPMPGDAIPAYVFCGYGNAAQADAFIDFCNRAGISRRVKVETHGHAYKLAIKQ